MKKGFALFLFLGGAGFLLASASGANSKKMTSPVQPARMRNDDAGKGHFGASRGGGTRKHAGVDFLCVQGQEVVSPIEGRITSHNYPYPGDTTYTGLTITGQGKHEGWSVKMYYMTPTRSVGTVVKEGAKIGVCQAISRKHGSKMLDHLHVEIRKSGNLVDPETIFNIEK